MTETPSGLVSRRGILARLFGGLVLALTNGHVWWRPAWAGLIEPASQSNESHIVRVSRPLDAETPVREFVSWLTPNERFFVRSHFGLPQAENVDPSHWRLTVGGLVERPLRLRLDDLKQFEEVTLTAVVQCAGNGRAFYRPTAPGVQWERGAVGNAGWTGVRLKDVLAQAGLQPSAKHIQLQGADRPVSTRTPLFVRSIPIEKARHPDTILAYQMNGRPLPLLHGAPLRLITPGWMADSCIKWLTEITVGADEAKGYYMEKAYRYPVHAVEPGGAVHAGDMKPVEAMVVKSLIAQPAEGTMLKPGPVMIQGVAWTGEGTVVKVEVSTDEGQTWTAARFVGEASPYAWRQWQFVWQAHPGAHTILSRATDDRGNIQPLASPWNPGGFLWNGVDRVRVNVANG